MRRLIAFLLGAYICFGIGPLFNFIRKGEFQDAIVLTLILAFLSWVVIRLWRKPSKKFFSKCSKCGVVKPQSLLYHGMCKKCYILWKTSEPSQAFKKTMPDTPISNAILYNPQRDDELIQESLKIIESTANIETFLSRYEFMLIKTKAANDESMFSYYSQRYDDYLNDAIQRYCHEAYKLKTDRGRKTRIDKLCNILQSQSTNFECMDAANHLAAAELLEQKDSPSFERLFDSVKPIGIASMHNIPTFNVSVEVSNDNQIEKNDSHTGNYQEYEKSFTNEEEMFFNQLKAAIVEAGLKTSELKAIRLSSGTFTVDYMSEGYLGKVCISTSPDKFRVLKQDAKRAIRVFSTRVEAEEYINGRSDYQIECIKGNHTYFMQYFIGLTLHNDYVDSLQELIDLIPRWIKYIRYMQKH